MYIDLIGPWKIIVNSNICELKTFMRINPVTNIVMLIHIIYKMEDMLQSNLQTPGYQDIRDKTDVFMIMEKSL